MYTAREVAHLVANHFVGTNVKFLSCIQTVLKQIVLPVTLNIKQNNARQVSGAKSTSKPIVQLCPDKMTPIEEYRSAREAGRKIFEGCSNRSHKTADCSSAVLTTVTLWCNRSIDEPCD